MGIGCSYHPYECSHDKYCEHCTLAETDWHTPATCALCDYLPDDHPDKRPLRKMVDEPFAIQARVKDYSHRKLKVFVKRMRYMPQEELPF